MSEIKAIEKLRELCASVKSSGFVSVGRVTVLEIADEIEREHTQRVAELNGAVCERDGCIGAYERRNTELNDALKAICKRFGVSTEWSAEDAAKKVLEALESQYMERPRDADGVSIYVGDRLRYADFIVKAMALTPERVYWLDESCEFHWFKGVECHHHEPRTLEDVLKDLAYLDPVHRYSDEDFEPIISKYADEIRELMKC